MTILAKLAIAAGLIYLAVCSTLFLVQRRLLYVPDTGRPTPAEVGLTRTEEVTARTADGLTLTGWWLEAAADRPVLLYFHGNGGNIGGRANKAEIMRSAGYSILLAGYRGYGGNPGTPSEAGLIADGRAWLDHLEERGVDPARVVLYGESLGSGVATALAAERSVAAVVLEAPFTSIRAIAERRYWYVPVRLLLRDPFDSLARIARVRAPLLILHGDADALIPPAHGEALHAAAPEPKRFVLIPGATHTSLVEDGAFAEVERFVADHEIATQNR